MLFQQRNGIISLLIERRGNPAQGARRISLPKGGLPLNQWEKINLGGEWVMAFLGHDEFTAKNSSPVTCEQVKAFTPKPVEAEVPGNFELDLMRAGLLEDPFYADHVLAAQNLESCHVWYSRKFTFHAREKTQPELVFEGLDTVAEIYLNGELLAGNDDMLVPHVIPAPGLREGENDITVHILPACIAARSNRVSAGNAMHKYNYETVRLRKAPSMFGWDIAPRIVSCGIFRPVYVRFRPQESFRQSYLMTSSVNLDAKTARLHYFFEFSLEGADVSQYSVELSGVCGDHSFREQSRLWFTAGKLDFEVKDAAFWWPKGRGEQNLYEVTAALLKNGKVLDTDVFRAGIRTVALLRTSMTDQFHSGDFHFEVNGKRIFILGTNFVPIDSFHSRDRSRLPKVTQLLGDIGCNAIRCWGGGIYEDDFLFDYCDENGILVWQDFIMACGQYPNDDDFCRTMAEETTLAVRRLRQHPSLLLWAGDNECDYFSVHTLYQVNPVNPDRNRVTRETLPNLLVMEDPTRPFLPSSPFIDEKVWRTSLKLVSENHLWGPRDYFKSLFYRDSFCHFVSEIGYHGCVSEESLRRFISPDRVWPWQNNPEWILHASSPETDPSGNYVYRIELIAKQIRELFGTVPENLRDFILASQISQAEADKFFIEMFRLEKDHRSGIIWWNLIDCWPQFSDAVVDYYFDEKLAYYYIRQSQKPLLLTFSEPADWLLTLRAVNDTGKELPMRWKVTDYTAGGRTVLEGENTVGGENASLGSLPYSMGEKKVYVIEWSCGEYSGKNHYVAGNPPFSLAEYRAFLKKTYPFYREH